MGPQEQLEPSKDSTACWDQCGLSLRLFENGVVAFSGKARTTLVVCCRHVKSKEITLALGRWETVKGHLASGVQERSV